MYTRSVEPPANISRLAQHGRERRVSRNTSTRHIRENLASLQLNNIIYQNRLAGIDLLIHEFQQMLGSV